MFFQEIDHMTGNGCKQTLADFDYLGADYMKWPSPVNREEGFNPTSCAINRGYNGLHAFDQLSIACQAGWSGSPRSRLLSNGLVRQNGLEVAYSSHVVDSVSGWPGKAG